MEIVKNIMPKTFVSPMVRRDTDAALRRAERDINDNYRKLASMREMPELPKDITKIDKDFIERVFDPRLQAVWQDITLTEDERDEKIKQWQRIKASGLKLSNAIQGTLSQWPEAIWKFNPETNSFEVTDFYDIVDTRSTFDTPEEAKQHYALIQDALAAVRRLREWEQSQDAKTMPLLALIRLAPEQLAEVWRSGDALVDHRFDHLPGMRHENYSKTIII